VKALVTGATGFVGAAIVRVLLGEGHRVRALVRAGSDPANLSGLDVELATGDLADAPSLRAAARGCEAVFHAAADYRLWTPDPAVVYGTNVAGTARMLAAAATAGVPHFVHTSSVATLGLRRDGQPADETTPVERAHMVGHYKRSKFYAEQMVLRRRPPGMRVVVVSPSTPLGRGDVKPTPTGRIVADAIAGRIPAYVDTGLNIVHVDDVARGHLQAFQRGRAGQRYILGGENLSLADLLAVIAGRLGRRPPRIAIPHWLAMGYALAEEGRVRLLGGEPGATREGVRMSRRHMYFTSDKAMAELGYRPRPAEAAIAEAVDWFLARRRNDRGAGLS